MTIYGFLIIWIGIWVLMSVSMTDRKKIFVMGHKEERYNLLYAIIVFLPVILAAGFRVNTGDSLLSS